MSINLLRDQGMALDKQRFTWSEMSASPIRKLDTDAFTRVRIILMNGIEAEQNRFLHAAARMNRELQRHLALVRRAEQHQQSVVNWLNPPEQNVLETTLGYEQTAIEVTAAVAEAEPHAYLAQVYRFGLLEDFDHLFRYAALMDRLNAGDPDRIIQGYSDILPGRPTSIEHRHPHDDLRDSYERTQALPLTKFHALTIMAAENQTHDYYMNVGPQIPDPVGRALYAEIASIEEQHVTQYESIIDPDETWLEKWLLHEANEVYNYYGCVAYETNPKIKKVWERFLDYELGHLRYVANLFENMEKRDAAEILPEKLPAPIRYESHRDYVRHVLRTEVGLSARGTAFVSREAESTETRRYRDMVNADGSPSETVVQGFERETPESFMG